MTEPERPDITAIMVAHGEGTLAGVSLRSMLDAVHVAEQAGLEVETLVVLDQPDRSTREILESAPERGVRVVRVAYGDQGRVRNHAVSEARGRYVAFLDGDDLWTENWLADAFSVCESDPGRIVAHPMADWVFGEDRALSFPPDQVDRHFDPRTLRVTNVWDALCLAPAAAYRDHPFRDRALAEGYAFEDWSWNLETVIAGYLHKVVPDTVHFKRARHGSQFRDARAQRALPRTTPLHDYTWVREWEPPVG